MARTSKLWASTGAEITKDMIENCGVNSKNLADFVFALNKDQITYDMIMKMFGKFGGKSLANTYDLLEVPAGTFSYYEDKEKKKEKKNTSKFTTTIGIYLFNIYLRDFNFSREFDGWVGDSINKKVYGRIEQTLSYALLEDRIDTKDLKEFEDTVQWFMPFETVLTPNHTEKMLSCTKMISKKKAELIKKYKEKDKHSFCTIKWKQLICSRVILS